jgi:hypothetical protein
MHKVKWFAGLNNGENFYEGKGKFAEIKGESSPWNKFLIYLAENNLEITSLGLYTDDGKRFNLPSSGSNPKFKEFRNAEKPNYYQAFRKLATDVGAFGKEKIEVKGNEELFTVAEAVYDKHLLQIWVSESNPDNCWNLIIDR